VSGRTLRSALVAALGVVLLAAAAGADWLEPDPTLRDAQETLARAIRDTVQSATPPRLDSLGVALIRLGRLDEAAPVLQRALSAAPGDPAAMAGLGRIALWRDDQLGTAESLLAQVAAADPAARADLFATRLRRGEYAAAAEMAEAVDQGGRAPLLQALARARDVCTLVAGPEVEHLRFVRAWPVPLVKVRLNGQPVLMAVDTGVGDLLVDESAARRTKVEIMPSQTQVRWDGAHLAVRNALVQRIALGGMQLERVPAGVINLHRWSLETNPQGETVAGVIGLNVLRLFRPTLDQRRLELVLARPGRAWIAPAGAQRIAFQVWGENDLTVYGAIGGGRRMAMLLASGLPGCELGATADVFGEFGMRAGSVARAVTGVGNRIGGTSWTKVTVPSLAVGPLARDRAQGCVGALDAGETWPWGARRDAVLGGAFFRGRSVTIDWAGHALIVE
jgi:aspartyl protease/tetratricopeptide repeat protein